jgi:hypothetical protein
LPERICSFRTDLHTAIGDVLEMHLLMQTIQHAIEMKCLICIQIVLYQRNFFRLLHATTSLVKMYSQSYFYPTAAEITVPAQNAQAHPLPS